MGLVLLVAVGGAVGTVARYLLSLWLARPEGGFPVATLVINVTGCFAIGLLVPILRGWNVREGVQAGVLVGVLGGYTTFSTFGRETLELMEAGRWGAGAAYVGLSNGLGLLAAWLGVVAGRAAAG